MVAWLPSWSESICLCRDMSLCVPPISLASFLSSLSRYLPMSLSFMSPRLSLPVVSLTISFNYLSLYHSTAPVYHSVYGISLALQVVIGELGLATLNAHHHWYGVFSCGRYSMPLVSCFWRRYLLPLTDPFLLKTRYNYMFLWSPTLSFTESHRNVSEHLHCGHPRKCERCTLVNIYTIYIWTEYLGEQSTFSVRNVEPSYKRKCNVTVVVMYMLTLP